MQVLNMNADKGGTYVGRPTRWGNPYLIGPDGTREEVIQKYRKHLWEQIKSGEVTMQDLLALSNKDLLCWCAPKACHADILLKAIAWAEKENAS